MPRSKSDTEAPRVGIADPKLDIRNTKSDVEDPRIANEKEREKGLGDEVRGGSDVGQNLAPDIITQSMGMRAELGSKKQK
ncbi:hypothetical protein INT44_005075 [Umbelopsis vinacea]|uniref:Uncharacterized protein n=1 Tax=Umbelopsis vinacea TaxID=44442 RepID=A0A8H7UQM7_9FUNG|nr:hypothetical protein INT44_005075 [Umbelopsis vinacea]